MGNTYLRIPDALIRKSFQEVYDELSKKVEIKTTGSGISIATANALYSMNTYGYQQLQQDLKKGVSLVFKDITEFDETFPSAIAIGDIELNEDSTVKYGSRGVAITKNGLAGFDDSYNGEGDLPSFSLDTQGNLYLRGEVHAESGTFAGELKSAYGTFDTITAGILQNSEGSNKIDLNASGSQYFITLGWLDYLRSDGRFRLGNGTLRWDGTTFKLTSTDDTPNENVNYNFDDGTNGWSISAALEKQVVRYDDSSVPSGCPDIHCLKVKNPENADKWINNQNVEASEGEEFTYIAYVASDSSADYDISCYIVFLDSDKNYLSTGGSFVTVNSTNAKWRKIVTRGKAPQNTSYARFVIRIEENVNGTDAYWFITDCYLKRTRFGDDRVEISGRDISFYKTLEDTPYKTVKKIESGTANNGDIVNLTGFYDRSPSILVAPKNLLTYDTDRQSQSMFIQTKYEDLTGNVLTGEWSFKAIAYTTYEQNSKMDYIDVSFYCNNTSKYKYTRGSLAVDSSGLSSIRIYLGSIGMEVSYWECGSGSGDWERARYYADHLVGLLYYDEAGNLLKKGNAYKFARAGRCAYLTVDKTIPSSDFPSGGFSKIRVYFTWANLSYQTRAGDCFGLDCCCWDNRQYCHAKDSENFEITLNYGEETQIHDGQLNWIAIG